MKMRFLGPLDRVTGSCYWLDHEGTQFLIDCGIRQGEGDVDAWNTAPLPFVARDLKFVVLTHAHIDHCGLLPRLVREGFEGTVYATRETQELAIVSLKDSARYPGSGYRESDVDRLKWHEHAGTQLLSRPHPVSKDLYLVYLRSAHMLGAVSVQVLWGPRDAGQSSIVFSGDVGPNTDDAAPRPLHGHRYVPSPGRLQGGYRRSYAVLESTYGGRTRDPAESNVETRLAALRALMERTCLERQGVLMLPAFALDRTHDILFDLAVLFAREPERFGQIPVVLHAPLAARTLEIYGRGLRVKETTAKKGLKSRWLGKGASQVLGLDPDSVEHRLIIDRLIAELFAPQSVARGPGRPLPDLDESLPSEVRAFRRVHRVVSRPFEFDGPGILVTGGGMMEGGAVAHYMPLLRSPSTTLALAGYAGPGTAAGALAGLARVAAAERPLLVDAVMVPGAEPLPLSEVQATIATLPGYSGHADEASLVDWLLWEHEGQRGASGRVVFLTHGTSAARAALRSSIEARATPGGAPGPWGPIQVLLPQESNGWYDLGAEAWVDAEEAELPAGSEMTRAEAEALRAQVARLITENLQLVRVAQNRAAPDPVSDTATCPPRSTP